jgi:predicted site-specific integrase-resolvase
MSIEQIHDQVKDSSPRRAVLYARVSSNPRKPRGTTTTPELG